MRHIASISYGKDSLAQLEVMHQHGLPLTDIVTADIMATPEIPAYLPELVEFRERIDKEIKERYGIPVTHVKAEKSFVELFYRELSARSKYTGIYGWPPVFGHWCMKWLKQEPIKKYFDGLDCVQWIGIAADEPKRQGQLNERKRSALVEFGRGRGDGNLQGPQLGVADLSAFRPRWLLVLPVPRNRPASETVQRVPRILADDDGLGQGHGKAVQNQQHARRVRLPVPNGKRGPCSRWSDVPLEHDGRISRPAIAVR